MGRYVKKNDKPRPIHVTFTEKDSILRIFRNIANQSRGELSKNINSERTVERRNGGIPHKINDKAKEKNMAHTDTYFVVRGVDYHESILSVYSPFSDRVGLPLHNTPFPGVLMKSIGVGFFPTGCPS